MLLESPFIFTSSKMLLNQYKFPVKHLFLYEKSEDYSNFYLITFFQNACNKKKHLRVKTRVIINMINILSCIKRIFHFNDKHLTIYVREINKALAWQHFFFASFFLFIHWLTSKKILQILWQIDEEFFVVCLKKA